VLQTLLGLLDVMLDLYRAIDDVVHLDVFQRLDQVLNLDTGAAAFLEVETLDLFSDAAEPRCVRFVGGALLPLAVACEILGDLVDEVPALVSVRFPNLSLLRHERFDEGFEHAFELGQLEDELHESILIVGFVNDFSELGGATAVMK